MIKKFNNLTVVIVTYKTSDEILSKCISSINKNIKIIIVENSNDKKYIKNITKKFKNTKVIFSGKNIGYGAGNNLGINFVKTEYLMISNPDVIYNKTFFNNLKFYLESKINFSVIGPSYNNKNYSPYGSFNNQFDDQLKKKKYDSNFLKEVDWVIGCSMILNLKKIKLKNFFDENIFLYFEEVDLCKRIKNTGGKIFNSSKLIINHFGTAGSFTKSQEDKILYEKLKNWHFFWSLFYFQKKHFGFCYSFFKNFGKVIKFFFKIIYFQIVCDHAKKTVNKYRFLGLFSSMMGKKSFFRII